MPSVYARSLTYLPIYQPPLAGSPAWVGWFSCDGPNEMVPRCYRNRRHVSIWWWCCCCCCYYYCYTCHYHQPPSTTSIKSPSVMVAYAYFTSLVSFAKELLTRIATFAIMDEPTGTIWMNPCTTECSNHDSNFQYWHAIQFGYSLHLNWVPVHQILILEKFFYFIKPKFRFV